MVPPPSTESTADEKSASRMFTLQSEEAGQKSEQNSSSFFIETGMSDIHVPFDPLKQKVLYINSALHSRGVTISLRQGEFSHSYDLSFPEEIWAQFPDNFKKMLRDNIAHLSTIELGIMFNLHKMKYDTPLPHFKSFFVELVLKTLIYSGDCASGKAVDYISRLCNMEFSFASQSLPVGVESFASEEQSINTVTFGKESLVSYGLCKELGLNPILVTVIEPDMDIPYKGKQIRSFENKHKEVLIKQFEDEFGAKVYKIHNELGDLRFYANWGVDMEELGWSSQLTEYMFSLVPFCYALKGKYIVFGNEKSCDSFYYSKEGFKCNPVYDQSTEWIGHMNAILHSFTNGNVKATSLVQPIHEIAVCKVLYQRYPELAKYQTSCHMDEDTAENNRWCGKCSKCARLYVFMRALNFDPSSVGLRDMFTEDCKRYYSLFHSDKDMRDFDSLGLGKEEQLFAFLLAVKNGAQGDLIDLFKKEYYEDARSREDEFRAEFFKVQKPLNVPSNLWKKLKPIFEEELKK